MKSPQLPETAPDRADKNKANNNERVAKVSPAKKKTANQPRENESLRVETQSPSKVLEKDRPTVAESEKPARRRRTTNWPLVQLIVSILSLIASLIIGILTLTVKTQVGIVENRVKTVESSLLKGQFIIDTPKDGADDVSLTEIVRGKTPLPEMKHYIVVTSVEAGSDFIQDKPVTIYAGGLFTGEARFGQGNLGQGEKYIVRVLASKIPLTPGILSTVPEDAVFSEPIIVTRKR